MMKQRKKVKASSGTKTLGTISNMGGVQHLSMAWNKKVQDGGQ
jgi:hypothetical protein